MFHLWYINIPNCTFTTFNSQSQEVSKRMNGESRRSFAVALASFAVGAAIASVLNNPKARKQLALATKKLVRKADIA